MSGFSSFQNQLMSSVEAKGLSLQQQEAKARGEMEEKMTETSIIEPFGAGLSLEGMRGSLGKMAKEKLYNIGIATAKKLGGKGLSNALEAYKGNGMNGLAEHLMTKVNSGELKISLPDASNLQSLQESIGHYVRGFGEHLSNIRELGSNVSNLELNPLESFRARLPSMSRLPEIPTAGLQDLRDLLPQVSTSEGFNDITPHYQPSAIGEQAEQEFHHLFMPSRPTGVEEDAISAMGRHANVMISAMSDQTAQAQSAMDSLSRPVTQEVSNVLAKGSDAISELPQITEGIGAVGDAVSATTGDIAGLGIAGALESATEVSGMVDSAIQEIPGLDIAGDVGTLLLGGATILAGIFGSKHVEVPHIPTINPSAQFGVDV